jgi:hypothetical protein
MVVYLSRSPRAILGFYGATNPVAWASESPAPKVIIGQALIVLLLRKQL